MTENFRNEFFDRNRCSYIQESIYRGEKVNKVILREAIESIYDINTSDIPNKALTETSTLYVAHVMLNEGVKDIDKKDILKDDPRKNPEFEVMYKGLQALINTETASLDSKENAKKLLDLFGNDCLTSDGALKLIKTAYDNNDKHVRVILNSIYAYWLYLGTKTLVGSVELKNELSLSTSDVLSYYYTKSSINSLISNTHKMMISSGKQEEFLVGALSRVLLLMVDILIFMVLIHFFVWLYSILAKFIHSKLKDIINTVTNKKKSKKINHNQQKKHLKELQDIEDHNKKIDKEIKKLIKKKIKKDSGSNNPVVMSSSYSGMMWFVLE